MASYVFTFTAASSDLATYKEIELEPSLGGYAQANSGHQAIDISATDSAGSGAAASTLQLAWADGTTAATSNLGVTKIDTVTITPNARKTAVANSGTPCVCVVSAASSSSSLVRTVGVGDVIDARVTPSTVLPKRRLFIGLTALGAGAGTITVIVTPTKII